MGNKAKGNKGGKKKFLAPGKAPIIHSKTKISSKKPTIPKSSSKINKAKKGKENVVNEDPEIDIEIEEEDREFFQEHSKYSSFLNNIDGTKLETKNEKKNEKNKEENKPSSIEDAESRPRRQASWEEKEVNKLPIKTLDGHITKNETDDEDENDENDKNDLKQDDSIIPNESQKDENENEEDDESEMDEELEMEEINENDTHAYIPSSFQNTKDLERIQAERLALKKIEIAKLSESILENPENGLKKSKDHEENLSSLQQLHALCEDEDPMVCQLAMVSETSIFLDILPSYRIRQITSSSNSSGDKKAKLKKTVQQLENFETSLLANYQRFLKYLDTTASIHLPLKKEKKKKEEERIKQPILGRMAIKCLSELLKQKYSFNFNLNLMMVLIPYMNYKDEKISDFVCQSIEFVFQEDRSHQASLEIVKQMTQYLKKYISCLQSRMIETLIKIPLNVTMEQSQEARKQARSDRRKRKRLQMEGDTIASGLKEAEATVDKAEQAKTQGEILHEIVLIYFRILKLENPSKTLPVVLKGLSKFSYLINFDIMMDLLKVFKILLHEEKLSLYSSLQAIHTGVSALQGPGKELLIDEKDFIAYLYKLLLDIPNMEDENDPCLLLAIQTMEILFLKRKEIRMERVAAFVKRLLLIAMYLPTNQILCLLSFIRNIFHRYPKIHQMLENDQDRVTEGLYRADIHDPDFSNPFASACWEFSLLQCHYHPKVASFAHDTACVAPSLPSEAPQKLYDEYHNLISNVIFKPSPKLPLPHPFHKRLEGLKKANKRQRHRTLNPKSLLVKVTNPCSPFLQQCYDMESQFQESIQTREELRKYIKNIRQHSWHSLNNSNLSLRKEKNLE